MAVLPAGNRSAVLVRLSKQLSDSRDPWPLNRGETVAFLAALDDFMEANAATINAALPVAARTGLTVRQKARGLSAVVAERYGVS